MSADFQAHLARFRAQEPRADQALTQCAPVVHRLRPAGFEGLLRLIVEQQLSVSAAAAIRLKLWDYFGTVEPEMILKADDQALRDCGLSRPKIVYAKGLAQAVQDGGFSFDSLPCLSDQEALIALTKLKGIGLWSAEVYLMFCEGRLDLFPAGDIAIREALAWLDQTVNRPDEAQSRLRACDWDGFRSVAAHALWAIYGGIKSGLIAPR